VAGCCDEDTNLQRALGDYYRSKVCGLPRGSRIDLANVSDMLGSISVTFEERKEREKI